MTGTTDRTRDDARVAAAVFALHRFDPVWRRVGEDGVAHSEQVPAERWCHGCHGDRGSRLITTEVDDDGSIWHQHEAVGASRVCVACTPEGGDPSVTWPCATVQLVRRVLADPDAGLPPELERSPGAAQGLWA